MKRQWRPKFHLSVGLKTAGIVILFEFIMLTAYTILTNLFVSQQQFLEAINFNSQNLLIIILISSFVMAGYLTYLFITRIFSPVSELIKVTDNIIKGDLDQRVEIRTGDELEVLAERFNAMAAALRAERASLENKVRQRTGALEESQRKEIERQNEILHLKDEFLFVAAHELRTPVTSIRWSLESIEDAPKLSKEVKLALNDAILASKDLSALVEDLLNMSRLDSKRIEFKKEPVDLLEVVNDVVKELSPMAKKRNVALKADLTGSVSNKALADARRLREVLINLVSNGIKFNHENGRVVIKAGSGGDKARISVEDDGPGISPEEQKHLFEKFWRSKAQTGVEGSGLGLFITKRLVEGMNGTVSFESKLGRGTTFTVFLPTHDG